MTPEQEDAHWALMGKPLMRHWLARLAELERADEIGNTARRLQWQAIKIDETLWAEVNALEDKAARIRRAAAEAWWAAIPDNCCITQHVTSGSWVVAGVTYEPTDGTDYQLSQGE